MQPGQPLRALRRAATNRPRPRTGGLLRSVDDTESVLRPFCSERIGLGRALGRGLPSRMAGSETPSRTIEPLWRHMLGDRLRTLRHERGETLGETAARAGVSPQYLSEMERGAKEPSSEMIAAVAGALRVTLLDLTIAVAEELRTAAVAPARASVALAA